MARARSPDSIKAEQMYHDGMKLVDIAKDLNVPEGTVRRWKSTQKWEDKNPNKTSKKKSERSTKKKANVRKTGAPKGNKNAAGHKGVNTFQPGHKLNEKHGAYSKVSWDVLDEEEKEMIGDVPNDEEELLLQQIQLFSIRERRIMKAINKYREQKEPVVILGITRNENKRTFENPEDKALYKERIEEKIAKGDRLPGEAYDLQTVTENKDNIIIRLEKELSTVQKAKSKALDSLVRLRLERRKMEGENKGNEVVRAWADAVIRARGEADE